MIGSNDLITLAIILSLSTGEHLNVITLRGPKVKSSPVCGVSASPGGLLVNGEFAKAADENVVAIGEGGLNEFRGQIQGNERIRIWKSQGGFEWKLRCGLW